MELHRYLAEAERRHHFRVKTVVPLGDREMARLELAIARYQPLEISAPAKTILQKHPMDFRDLENAEVWIVDMVLGLPASPYVLQQDIRQNLGIPEKYVVVRGDGEPVEAQGEAIAALAALEDDAKAKGLRPAALLANPDYPEAAPVDGAALYGQAQVGDLLAYLGKVRDERAEQRTDPPHPIFRWLDMPDRKDQQPVQDVADFNAGIKDAPSVRGQSAKGAALRRSVQGNLDDDSRDVARLKMDQSGKTVVLRTKVAGVRKAERQ